MLHTRCVSEANTKIGGHHLWFSNMKMRAFVQERDLVSVDVAFCKGCHDGLSEQILDNYMMMERFDEGARLGPSTQICPVLLLALDLAYDAVIHAGLEVDDDLAWAMDLAQGALQPVAHIVGLLHRHV